MRAINVLPHNKAPRNASVEERLRAASRLIDSIIGGPSGRSAARQLGAAEPGAVVAELIGTARGSLTAAITGTGTCPAALAAGLRSAGPVLRRSIAFRVLLAPAALGAAGDRITRFAALGCQPRVGRGPLREVLLVDGHTALVFPAPGRPHDRAVLTSDPAVVKATAALLDDIWDRAWPLAQYRDVIAHMRKEPLLAVLHHLCEGHTDEVAAARLGMSLRTYRRQVAAIMRELGANSRFQAGARAAELGLMAEPAPAGHRFVEGEMSCQGNRRTAA